ncbi:hypothetical protein BDZ97DRAFT_1794576 [Flammula alnicola]|nr:hypothetical protein BDZ97DRAFT_1794576 [Flammula alnicola]
MIAHHHNNTIQLQCGRCTLTHRPSSPRRHRVVSSYNRRLHLAKAQRVPKVSAVMPSPSTTRISLPQTLPRPNIKEIDPRTLQAISPEYKDVHPQYVRDQLSECSPLMVAGLHSAQIFAPASPLPKELQVPMTDVISIPAICPTHILAFATTTTTPANGLPRTKYTLYPIHELVFVANCSSFPALPPSSASTPAGNMAATVTMPVVKLDIPSAETFPVLQSYLYTKDAAALQSTLLPADWASSITGIVQRAIMVQGFWRNACAFGVVDASVFDVIEDSWAQIIRALQQTTSTS